MAYTHEFQVQALVTQHKSRIYDYKKSKAQSKKNSSELLNLKKKY